MDVSYKQEITVGTLVIVAVVLFLVGTTWLSGRSIGADRDDLWHIQFTDIGNLKQSSVVRVSGVTVGSVEEIELEAPGKVLVGVALNDGIVPKVDATAEIVPVGFVGDAAIDLHPGQAAQPLPRDRVILGTQSAGVMAQVAELGDRADSVLVGIQAFANAETAKDFRRTLHALEGALLATEKTLRVYANPDRGPTAELTQTLASMRTLAARLDSTLASPALNRTLSRADTLTANLAVMTGQLASTSARLDTLLLRINEGRGTLGKLATDTAFYQDLRNLSVEMQGLLRELQKNPGKLGVTVKIF